MPVVRWAGGLLAAALLGCARGAPVTLAPAPPYQSAEGIATTLFLVGDAGAVDGADAVFAGLIEQGKGARPGSAIVFLGDNVYSRGIPAPADSGKPGYEEARRARSRLWAQAAVAKATGLRAIFVPGNHDWDRQGPNGWANVQRQGLLLEAFARDSGARVELQPRGGCPGPAVVDLEGGIRLVAIDTQWWLHEGPRPGRPGPVDPASLPEPDWRCPATTEAAFLDSLRAVHGRDRDRPTVMVAHHPLASSSEHGGHHPWIQYLLPAVPTPIAGWAWLPIGWIYPLGRKLLGHRQDLAGKVNREMRAALEGTFSPTSPFIYAAGHDHSLEILRRGPGRFYLVSGSGMEEHQSAVGRQDSTVYSSDRPGFIRIDLMADRRIRIGVTTLDRRSGLRETYQGWLTTSR